MADLEKLAQIVNHLENYYDHPASIDEDHNENQIGILYNGKSVDVDSLVDCAKTDIESRIKRLTTYQKDLDTIQRQRDLDRKYPDNPED